MTVTVLLEVQAQESKVDDLKALLKDNLGDTRTYDGCIGLDVIDNQDDSTNIVLVERWQSRAHYEKYLGWRQETGFVDTLVEHLSQPPSIRYYDAIDA